MAQFHRSWKKWCALSQFRAHRGAGFRYLHCRSVVKFTEVDKTHSRGAFFEAHRWAAVDGPTPQAGTVLVSQIQEGFAELILTSQV